MQIYDKYNLNIVRASGTGWQCLKTTDSKSHHLNIICVRIPCSWVWRCRVGRDRRLTYCLLLSAVNSPSEIICFSFWSTLTTLTLWLVKCHDIKYFLFRMMLLNNTDMNVTQQYWYEGYSAIPTWMFTYDETYQQRCPKFD